MVPESIYTNINRRIEEEYYEDEEPEQEVPALPSIPTEHLKSYEESKEPGKASASNDIDDDVNSFDENVSSPQMNLHKFQNIDLDEPVQTAEPTPTDEYTDIIRVDDSEDEEDYKPQSSSRFQPLPRSPEATRFDQPNEVEKVEPLVTEDEPEKIVEAQSSSFQPFPEEEQNISKVDHQEKSSTLPTQHEEPHPEPTPIIDEEGPSVEETSVQPPNNDFQPFPEEHEYANDEASLSFQESDGEENFKAIPAESYDDNEQESKQLEDRADDIVPNAENEEEHEYTPQIEDSEDEGEYVPQSNRFKSSILEETKDVEEPEIPNDEVEEEKEVHRDIETETPDLSVEEIGYSEVQPIEAPQQISIPPIPKTAPVEETVVTPKLQNDTLRVPSHDQEYEDISDTDTLHIRDPDSPESPYIEEIRRELSNTSLNDFPRDGNGFEEHAYLGSLINTPEPDNENETQFQKNEPEKATTQEKGDGDQPPRTLSQYYSSVNDYFDDYADNSDNENLKVRDSLASVQSSGSLSTGSFSIKSESRYRYSKASDRDSSLNHSHSEVHSINQDTASQTDSVKEQTAKNANLNPALSINFGHWRPDTGSFRDQFISGTAPPLPNVDSYTRNSMGQIVEDRGSIIETEKESDTEIHSKKDEDSHTKSSEHDKSIDSFGNTVSTTESGPDFNESKNKGGSYTTDSNSVLPLHIPLGTSTSESLESPGYFHEKIAQTETNLATQNENLKDVTASPRLNISKISGVKRTNYNLKQISAISDPQRRIDSLRNAREEEANLDLGLKDWLIHATNSADVALYTTNVRNSNVAKAYADASTMSRKSTLTNNVNSFLHKRRVFQDTSSHAQSLAKGIFTRGKKILKSDN